MKRVRVTAAAAAAVTTACFLVLTATTAGAADRPDVVIDSPGSGVLDSPGVTVSGRATMHELAGFQTNRVTRIAVALSSAKHPGPLPQCNPCATGDQFSLPFSWTTPALNWNGPYSVTVTAWGLEAVDVNGEEQSAAVRNFSLAVPAATPRDVKTTVNPDRTVTVSWAPNGEPDLIGYRVQRKEPGGSFTDAGGLVEPSGAPSLADAVPAQGPGGDYAYRVQAIRAGSDGTAGTAVASGFSGGGATVPNVDGGPPGTGPDGKPVDPAKAAAAGAAKAPPDLRGFLGGKRGGPKSSSPGLPKLPGTPDNGYDSNLPYPGGAKRRGAVQTITVGAAGLASNPRALAIPVAAGLVLFMVSFHLRLLSRRMDPGGMPPPAPS